MFKYFSGLPLFNKLFDNFTEAIVALRSFMKEILQEKAEIKLKTR